MTGYTSGERAALIAGLMADALPWIDTAYCQPTDPEETPFYFTRHNMEVAYRRGVEVALAAALETAPPTPPWPSCENIARGIAATYGVDPDDLAPRTTMCDAENRPVPWWMVYEEQASAVLAMFAVPGIKIGLPVADASTPDNEKAQ